MPPDPWMCGIWSKGSFSTVGANRSHGEVSTRLWMVSESACLGCLSYDGEWKLWDCLTQTSFMSAEQTIRMEIEFDSWSRLWSCCCMEFLYCLKLDFWSVTRLVPVCFHCDDHVEYLDHRSIQKLLLWLFDQHWQMTILDGAGVWAKSRQWALDLQMRTTTNKEFRGGKSAWSAHGETHGWDTKPHGCMMDYEVWAALLLRSIPIWIPMFLVGWHVWGDAHKDPLATVVVGVSFSLS